MKQDFLNFLEALMEQSPEFVAANMTDSIKNYIDSIRDSDTNKPEITDSGKVILKHLQMFPDKPFKARDIAEDLFISSRSVSGTMRKLVADGFCEKIGKDPAIYAITEKGKKFIIE
jgi:predicted transcriptional regulator